MRTFISLAGVLLLLLTISCSSSSLTLPPQSTIDFELAKFLAQANERLANLYNQEVHASWQNEITGPNDIIALLQSEIVTEEIMNYVRSIFPTSELFKRLDISDERLKRRLAQIPEIGYEALGRNDLERMYAVTANLSEIYKKSKICSFAVPDECDLTLMPQVQNILHASKNVTEIEYYWLEWRRKTGVAAKADFFEFAKLYRKAAKLNGFDKPSDFWFKDLEENSTEASALMDKFMSDLRPLFQQFHAHVRFSLRKQYGEELIGQTQPYPQNLAEIFIGNSFRTPDPKWFIDFPYPEVSMPNITEGLLRRSLNNPQRVFWNVADYFRSLGMPQLEHEFWKENTKPKANLEDDSSTCWHKAWKYYGINQVNFSYCPTVDEERFLNMFEAISDVYYYRAYQTKQPTLFEEEPFPNFSDALGKVFSLAASSPRYLQKLKAVEEERYMTLEARINRLYWQGLRTIFLLPVFYVLDRYRVEVLDERIDISDNCAYWELTETYTGAEPPVIRTNKDFDAPAKLLIEVDDQYTSQIMSTVLQYQLYKHFCELSGQYKKGDASLPLDLCDLSNQREVGPLVLKAMALGSSKPYKEILQVMTNETELKMDGLLEYFQPLIDWLKEQNEKDNVEIGWEKSNRCNTYE